MAYTITRNTAADRLPSAGVLAYTTVLIKEAGSLDGVFLQVQFCHPLLLVPQLGRPSEQGPFAL